MTCTIIVYNKSTRSSCAYVSLQSNEQAIKNCMEHLQMTHPDLKYEKHPHKQNEWIVFEQRVVKSEGWLWSSVQTTRKNLYTLSVIPTMHYETATTPIVATKTCDNSSQTDNAPQYTSAESQTDEESHPSLPTLVKSPFISSPPFNTHFGYAAHSFSPQWSRGGFNFQRR